MQGAALVAVRYLLVEYLFFTDGHKGRTLQAIDPQAALASLV